MRPTDLHEHGVAGAMAQVVVHALEVVEVEHDERRADARSAGAGHLALQRVVEGAAVVEAGERRRARRAAGPRRSVARSRAPARRAGRCPRARRSAPSKKRALDERLLALRRDPRRLGRPPAGRHGLIPARVGGADRLGRVRPAGTGRRPRSRGLGSRRSTRQRDATPPPRRVIRAAVRAAPSSSDGRTSVDAGHRAARPSATRRARAASQSLEHAVATSSRSATPIRRRSARPPRRPRRRGTCGRTASAVPRPPPTTAAEREADGQRGARSMPSEVSQQRRPTPPRRRETAPLSPLSRIAAADGPMHSLLPCPFGAAGADCCLPAFSA